MRFRVMVIALMLIAVFTTAQAMEPVGFYAGAGLDFQFISDADDADFSNPFIGINPRVGYRINDMFGVNAGYEYFFTKENDAGLEWSQSAIQISANIFPFKEGKMTNMYFIGGLALISWEFSGTESFFGQEVDYSVDDNETGIQLGAGYLYPMSENISLAGEVSYITSDAGGIQIEIGGRYYFGK